jgi:hypothetical protein
LIQERHETYMRRKFLEEEIQDLEKQIQPHDTGHIHTTISTLKNQYRILTGYDYGSHPNMTTVEAPDGDKKIYESPDGGKTVYERPFGAPYTERVLVKKSPFVQYGKDEHEVFLDLDAYKDLGEELHTNLSPEEDDWNGYDDAELEDEDMFTFEFLDWKYNEEELIQEFKDYVESTYDQHYSQNKYQATEIAIEAGHGTGFCIGNILKYAQRYGRKGTAAESRKDIMKIMHYALIQLYIHDNYES